MIRDRLGDFLPQPFSIAATKRTARCAWNQRHVSSAAKRVDVELVASYFESLSDARHERIESTCIRIRTAS